VNSIAFHPEGNFLLSSSNDQTLKITDLRQGQVIYTLYGHERATFATTFSQNGEFFASGGADNNVLAWKSTFDTNRAPRVMFEETPARSSVQSAPRTPSP